MQIQQPQSKHGVRLNVIWSEASNGIIGHGNEVPWRLQEDLERFEELTMGQTVIMGRKTFESIGGPLPGRTNYVLSTNSAYQAPGAIVVSSFDEALALAARSKVNDIFVCGGAETFKHAIPIADKLYVTEIHTNYIGDTFMPAWDESCWFSVSGRWFDVDTKRNIPGFCLLEFVRRPAEAVSAA